MSDNDTANTNTNVLDDIMNITGPDTTDAADATDSADSSADATNAADSTAPVGSEGTEGTEAGVLPYPRVLRTYSADEVGAGENPPDALTVNEFAAFLTFREFQKGNTDFSAMVHAPAVYQALKAKRHPIPVVLVLPANSTDPSDARVFIPQTEGVEAWDSRPARGSGSDAAGSSRSQDELMATAAKKLLERNKIQARLDRATEQLGKADKTVAKYVGWLAQFYANDRDAATAAMQEAADKLAAESESDSAIDDNGNPITPAE